MLVYTGCYDFPAIFPGTYESHKDRRPFYGHRIGLPMVKKTSNKELIRQKAEEAAAGKKEKVEKKKKTTTRKKAATTASRRKMVWKVFDAGYKEVACFPYPEKNKAYSTADDLTKKKNKSYFVNDVSVPM